MFWVLVPPKCLVPRRDARGDVRSMRCRNDCKRQRSSEVEYYIQYTAHFPRKPHSFALITLWPDEVKEESCAEDGGDEYSRKDVVGGRTDIVIVIHFDPMPGDGRDSFLSVNVICGASGVSFAR